MLSNGINSNKNMLDHYKNVLKTKINCRYVFITKNDKDKTPFSVPG